MAKQPDTGAQLLKKWQNPQRGGEENTARTQFLDTQIKGISYQAKGVASIGGGYQLRQTRGYDQYPSTYICVALRFVFLHYVSKVARGKPSLPRSDYHFPMVIIERVAFYK